MCPQTFCHDVALLLRWFMPRPGPLFHMINTKQKAWPFKLSNCISVLSRDNERTPQLFSFSKFSVDNKSFSQNSMPFYQVTFIKTEFSNCVRVRSTYMTLEFQFFGLQVGSSSLFNTINFPAQFQM